ncbi:MAG: hypothetical protein LBR31_07880 [Desulfovibrio sp.]|jgi:hypothetical protein|nr:hypothetical protein [Desulfovibrio sp.]
MKLAAVNKFVCVAAVLLLCACGESNPLIGTWKIGVQGIPAMAQDMMKAAGLDSTGVMIFTETEMVTKQGGQEQREKIQYRKNSENSWSISTDGMQWQEVKVVDKNTLSMAGPMGMSLELKRDK